MNRCQFFSVIKDFLVFLDIIIHLQSTNCTTRDDLTKKYRLLFNHLSHNKILKLDGPDDRTLLSVYWLGFYEFYSIYILYCIYAHLYQINSQFPTHHQLLYVGTIWGFQLLCKFINLKNIRSETYRCHLSLLSQYHA